MIVLDGPDGLNPEDRRFCRAQGVERLPRSEQAFQPLIAALYAVVPPLQVDVQTTVEVRVLAVVPILDDLPVSWYLVSIELDRPVEPDTLDRLLWEGFGGIRIPLGGPPQIDELAYVIPGAPKGNTTGRQQG